MKDKKILSKIINLLIKYGNDLSWVINAFYFEVEDGFEPPYKVLLTPA